MGIAPRARLHQAGDHAEERLLELVFPAHEGSDRASRRLALRVVLALVGASWALGIGGAILLPLLHGPDEKVHLAYVAALLEGDLPTVDTPVPRDGGPFPNLPLGYGGSDQLETFGDRGDVWVANHPPLSYLVAAPVAGLGAALGFDEAGPLTLRALSATGFAVGLIATAAVAHALFPSRVAIAATAVGIAGLCACLLGTASYGYIDGPAFGVGTAYLATILRTAQAGPSRGRLIALLALGAASALTRVALLPLAVLATAVWLVVSTGQRRNQLLTLAVGAAPLIASGWFYRRNLDLYGSISGASHLFDKLGRRRAGSTAEVALRPRVWLGLWQAMWAQSGNGTHLGSGNPRLGQPEQNLGSGLVVGALLALGAAVGALATVLRTKVHLRWSVERWLPWLVVVAWTGVSLVGVASFLAGGGSPHGRYLLPILPVAATVLAAGLLGLPKRLHPASTTVLGLAALQLVLLTKLDTAIAVINLPDALYPPTWASFVVWVLFGVALALLVRAVAGLDRLPPAFPAVGSRPDHPPADEAGLTSDR